MKGRDGENNTRWRDIECVRGRDREERRGARETKRERYARKTNVIKVKGN